MFGELHVLPTRGQAALLAAARDLIASDDFADGSVGHIAAAAGMTTEQAAVHFRSTGAVIELLIAEESDRWDRTATETALDPDATLADVLIAHRAWWTRDDQNARLLWVFVQQALGPAPELRRQLTAVRRRFELRVRGELMQLPGHRDEHEAATSAALLTTILVGMAMHLAVGDGAQESTADSDLIARLIAARFN